MGPRRALEGIRGHQRIQRSRPAGYRKEVAVAYDMDADEFALRVEGRIDGLLEAGGNILVEEIKTVRGDGREPDPLHWAQARAYAALIARERGCEEVTIQVTLLDLDTGRFREFIENKTASDLASYLAETVSIYVKWLSEQLAWRRLRDRSIAQVAFPFPEYRPGQRKLAVAVYRALVGGRRLFLEAPTGIGKTMSVVFPAVKAAGEGRIDRVFYLTARTTARGVAEKAFTGLRAAGLRFRTLTLTAKEKICSREGQACDPQACPLARGYYDRLEPALREGLAREELTRPVIEQVAAAHQLCPFEFSLDLSLWVDAVICDYNYVFDPKVYLRRHFDDAPGGSAFLVDEAHNLVDRARDMFSADLEAHEVRATRRMVKDALPRCARVLGKLGSAIAKCGAEAGRGSEVESPEDDSLEPGLPLGVDPPAPAAESARAPGWPGREGVVLREPPEFLRDALDRALAEMESWLVRNEPADFRDALLQLYFRLFSFRRTLDLFDESYVVVSRAGRYASVRLLCLDPSFLLGQALRRGKAAVFFSATLAPADYYRDLLGGAAEDDSIRLPSPFPPEHLAVLVHDRVRTQFRARQETLRDVAEAIEAVVGARAGNYLAYFPSHQYLADVHREFTAAYPGLRTLAQQPAMTEPERDAFLAEFGPGPGATAGPPGEEGSPAAAVAAPANPVVGFAVLGGVFGEGIDLVGDRLIGAIIVGVGLPQLCLERDLIRDYFQRRNGAGFEYAYTFPGMNRVLQAIGRVIRAESDRGVVLLADTRYAERRYARLFPSHWRTARARSTAEIRQRLREFWRAPLKA